MTWYRSVRPGCCIRGNAGSAIFNEPHAHIQIDRKHEGFGIISNSIKTFVCLNDKFFDFTFKPLSFLRDSEK